MKIAIINGHLIDPTNQINTNTNLYIADKKIVAVKQAPEGFNADETINASDQLIIPGIIDLQARLREPGNEHKATIATETQAAAASGITTLCCPPDTLPVIDTPAVTDLIQHRAASTAKAQILPIGALTLGLQGKQLSEMHALKEAGCVALSNARQPIMNLQTVRQALQYAATFDIKVFLHPMETSLSANGIVHQGPVSTRLGLNGIPVCAETIAIAQYLELIEITGVKAHFGQISSARGIELIAAAKQRGLPVTMDVAMHQLFLIDNDLLEFNGQCHVLPPLRSQNDREALRAAVKHNLLDAICSDHQPHEADAKLAPLDETEAGISALDTLLPLALRLADEDELPLEKIIPLLTCGPAQILQKDVGHLTVGAKANICIIDPKEVWNLTTNTIISQGKNTPFLGWEFTGKVTHTFLNGENVFKAKS